jgi:hypothetical protein
MSREAAVLQSHASDEALFREVQAGKRDAFAALVVRLGKIQGERLSSMDEQKPTPVLSFLEHTVILSEVVDSHQNGHQTRSMDSRMDTTAIPRLCLGP